MSDQLQKAQKLIEADRLDEAEVVLHEHLEREPSSAQALHGLGYIEALRQRPQLALGFLERAATLRPNDRRLQLNLGIELSKLGKNERATAHLREAIRLKPDYASAFYHLSGLRRFEADDPLIQVIEDLLTKGGLTRADQCFLHFALGKAYDDNDVSDRAIKHFHKANTVHGARYDPSAELRFLKQSIASYTPEFMNSLAGAGIGDEQMIFVVGMPRSGTSLVEQVISSHPQAHGAGELRNLQALSLSVNDRQRQPRQGLSIQPGANGAQPLGAMLSLRLDDLVDGNRPASGRPDASQVPTLAKRYLREVLARETSLGMSPKIERIVDKMPMNFQHVGLIRLLFPKARIIHCRRDPRDTCLSCYFQYFQEGHSFSFDLAHLGFYYRYYVTLMRHWRDVLGIEMLEVDYERLTSEPEPMMREIIAYCGLPWDDACLEFHKTKRPVLTASSAQVRQPLYQRSAGRWRNYKKHLGPLLKALRGEKRIGDTVQRFKVDPARLSKIE